VIESNKKSETDVTLAASAAARWPVAAAKYRLQLVVAKTAVAGSRVPILLQVTNIGNATAENVRFHLDLPENLTYRLGRRLKHNIGRLEPGKTYSARLTTTAQHAGRVSLTAAVIDVHQKTKARETVRIVKRTLNSDRAP